MEYRIERLNQYLRGWMGYFGLSRLYGPIPELDGWPQASNTDVPIGNNGTDRGRALAIY